ncbi:MAG: hypothetical protein WAW09_03445 [Smithella sp.]
MKIFLLLMVFLVSCSNQLTYPAMKKYGASDQQRRTDTLECKRQAIDYKSKAAAGIGGPVFPFPPMMIRQKKELYEATEAANQFYIECMEERGYGIVKENESVEIK